MAEAKLKVAAENVAREGWKWIVAAISLPYNERQRLRRIDGERIGLSEEQAAERGALVSEYERLDYEYWDGEAFPEDIDARLVKISEMIAAIDRLVHYDAKDIARAGAFVSVRHDGDLFIDRGYVDPENG